MNGYFKLWLSKELTEAAFGIIIVVVVIILVLIIQHFEKRGE